MKEHKSARRKDGAPMAPNREHWWWRESQLRHALDANPQLDHFFYWKIKGRKSPQSAAWTAAERRTIETALWLYELDARISRRFLFGKPAHLLDAKSLCAVIEFAWPMRASAAKTKTGAPRKAVTWVWLEYLDKRNDKRAPKLTRKELDGVIAAMRFCMEYFLHG